MKDCIVILDLGSEENERVLGELQALGVDGVIQEHTITLEELHRIPNVKGLILNGGPRGIEDGKEWEAALEIYNCEIPALMVAHKGDDPWPEDPDIRDMVLRAFVFSICGVKEQK